MFYSNEVTKHDQRTLINIIVFIPLIASFLFLSQNTSAQVYSLHNIKKNKLEESKTIFSEPEDSWYDIAMRHNLTAYELQKNNPAVDQENLPAWTSLQTPEISLPNNSPREGIVVDLKTLRLFFYPKNGSSLKSVGH